MDRNARRTRIATPTSHKAKVKPGNQAVTSDPRLWRLAIRKANEKRPDQWEYQYT
jgi:hypothetical protein